MVFSIYDTIFVSTKLRYVLTIEDGLAEIYILSNKISERSEDILYREIKGDGKLLNRSINEVEVAFEEWLDSLSPKELAQFEELMENTEGVELDDLIEDEVGVKIVEDDEIVAPKEEIVEPKVAVKKVKCRCCGFAKKHYRVNAEGICKVCYVALATSDSNSVTIVGRQGKKGHNTVSVVVGGTRVKVQRKARLDS